MPSFTHEAFVRLFRDRPELAPELLERALGVVLPAYTEARTDSADLTELAPTEYRADLVVLLVDDEPVLGIIVEVQLQAKSDKRFTWPVYVAALRVRLRCPVCLLVVTPYVDVGALGALADRAGAGCTPRAAGARARRGSRRGRSCCGAQRAGARRPLRSGTR